MSRPARLVVLVLLLAVVVLGALIAARGRQPARSAGDLVVYAPCGMTNPIGAAASLFRQTHPDTDLEIVYDNAVVLVRKIRRGDRPDVFISPGEVEMRQLVEEGYVEADTVRDFGTLDLVVFAPRATRDLDTVDDLKQPHIKRISLAKPDLNSVGYYAQESLTGLGLWSDLAPKIFLQEFPLDAVTMVTDGVVDAGITYLTCPLDTAPEKADKSEVRIVATLPRDSYPPVRCQVGVLRANNDRPVARLFADFMISDQAQQAIEDNGLLPAEEIEPR